MSNKVNRFLKESILKAFISYSHYDSRYLDRFRVHLKQLIRQGLIQTWYDRRLLAGDEIDEEINANLNDSELFIALVSPDFIASEYCYSNEMKAAFEKQARGELRIVAVVLEPCEWRKTPLKDYLVLPIDGKEVSNFSNENAAFLQVAEGIRKLLERPEIAAPNILTESKPDVREIFGTGLRSKMNFDDLDRANFRDDAFESIDRYFQNALHEVEALDGLNTRFDRFERSSFTASISNKNVNTVGHITVHSGAKGHMGDIFFSFGERSSKNTSNGNFNIENDEYEQYFSSHLMGFGSYTLDDNARLSSNDVAQVIFNELMKQAGLAHA